MAYPKQDEVRQIIQRLFDVGVESELAKRAMASLDGVLSAALRAHYVSPRVAAAPLLELSEEVYQARLIEAHVALWMAYINETRVLSGEVASTRPPCGSFVKGEEYGAQDREMSLGPGVGAK